MDWSPENLKGAADRYARAVGEGGFIKDGLSAVMSYAVELLAARGGTMTAEVGEIEREVSELLTPRGRLPSITEALDCLGRVLLVLQTFTSQGATVATLQAKLEEARGFHDGAEREVTALQAKVAELDRMWRAEKTTADRYEEERDAARAEVERLKAAHEQRYVSLRRAYVRWMDRANTAESRLAAIRERSTQVNALGIRVAAQMAQRAHRDAAHRPWTAAADAAVRWVLEGDAPNSPGFPDGSNAPQEAKTRCIHASDWPCAQCKANARHNEAATGKAYDLLLAGMKQRHPCSDTCTHDDAATPGHPERVKEQSAAVVRAAMGMPPLAKEQSEDVGVVATDPVGELALKAGAKRGREVASYRCGYEQACDDMRAACLEAALGWAQKKGLSYTQQTALKAAIEGAAP